MSKSLKELLVGLLLGDASIKRSGANKARLSFAQSSEKRDYFHHVYDSIKAENLLVNDHNIRTYSDPRYPGKTYTSYQFSSKSSEELRPLADLFLDANGQKIIPSNILDLLTPKSLAYWIMDDGQQVKRGGVTLCTDSFKHDEIIKLQEALKSKFDLKTTIHVKKGAVNTFERIYISKDPAFESLKPSVVEHMEKSMLYKLNIGTKPVLNTNLNTEINSPTIDSPTNTRVGTLTPFSLTEADNLELEEMNLGREMIGDTINPSNLDTADELILEALKEFIKEIT